MQKIKERLFGLVVLTALGIIFVPMFLPQNNKKINLTELQTNPPAVNTAIQPINEPENIVVLNQLEKPELTSIASQAIIDETSVANTTQENATVKETIKSAVHVAKAIEKEAQQLEQPIASTETKIEKTLPIAMSNAWIIQLATFKSDSNANKLVKKLQNDGYPAYTKQFTNKSGNLFTIVLVGPKTQKDEAAELKQTLKSKYRLNGIVKQHISS